MQFFKGKISGIDVEKRKNSKDFQLSTFLLNFCQTVNRRRRLER